MPGTTPNYRFRYPTGGDTPQAAVDMANLANDVDAGVKALQPLGCEYRCSAALNIANATTWTVVPFDTAAVGNTLTGYDTTAGIFTVPASGLYEWSCSVAFQGGSIRNSIALWLNGTQRYIGYGPAGDRTGSIARSAVLPACRINLNAGDSASIQAWVQTSVGLYVGSGYDCWVYIKKIS